MTVRHSIAALILSAGLAGTVFAATSAPTPVAVDQETVSIRLLDEAKLSMTDALAKAEKAHDAKATRAVLRESREYGLVWDVKMEKGDTRIRTLVDAKTGQVLASDELGIRRGHWQGAHHMRGDGRWCGSEGRGYGEGRHCR